MFLRILGKQYNLKNLATNEKGKKTSRYNKSKNLHCFLSYKQLKIGSILKEAFNWNSFIKEKKFLYSRHFQLCFIIESSIKNSL